MLPLPPDEQLEHFILPPGYRIELVLSDPDIQEPTAIAFDGNDRMFVLEDRTYMQDADAMGQLEPISRISMHEDVDNDGVYEQHSVFVDGLVFPRSVLRVQAGVDPRGDRRRNAALQRAGQQDLREGAVRVPFLRLCAILPRGGRHHE